MTFVNTSQQWGKCRGCRAIEWSIQGERPVVKHICGPVRLAWVENVERRRTPRTQQEETG